MFIIDYWCNIIGKMITLLLVWGWHISGVKMGGILQETLSLATEWQFRKMKIIGRISKLSSTIPDISRKFVKPPFKQGSRWAQKIRPKPKFCHYEGPHWALLGIEPKSLPIWGSVLTTRLQNVDIPKILIIATARATFRWPWGYLGVILSLPICSNGE